MQRNQDNNHDLWKHLNEENDEQLKLQVQRLESTRKTKEEEEEARKHNLKQLRKIKKIQEDYELFSEAKRIALEIYAFVGRAIEIGGNIFPPLKAAISGVGAILEITETLFLRKETLNRKAIRITNSIIATGTGVASFVLACNPVTAPIGALLFAVSSAAATIKDGIFWYKESRDLRKAKQELETIKDDTYHDESRIMRAKEKVDHFQQRRDNARSSCFYSAFSCIGSSLATVAAFALVGALTIHPFGILAIGITAVAIAGALTVMSIKDRFFSKSKDTAKTHDTHSASKKTQTKQPKHAHELSDEDIDKERQGMTRKPIHEATETIAHALAPKSKEAEVKLLQADIETYKNLGDTVTPAKELSSPSKTKVTLQKDKTISDEDSDDNSDSEHEHPHPK